MWGTEIANLETPVSFCNSVSDFLKRCVMLVYNPVRNSDYLIPFDFYFSTNIF